MRLPARIRPLSPVALLGAAGTGALAAASPRGVAALLAAGAGATLAFGVPALWLAHGLSLASFLSGLSIPFGELKVRPEQAAGLLAAAGLLRRPSRSLDPLTLLAGVWMVAGVAGALGEPDTARAFAHTARLAVTVVPLLALPALLDRSDAERAWSGFLVLAVVEAAVGIGAAVSNALLDTAWGITPEPVLGYVHPHGTLLEPNVLGALSACAAVALTLRAREKGLGGGARLLAGLGALVCAGAVGVSLTRAAWLSLPLVLGLLWIASPARDDARLRRWRRVAAAALALAVAGAGALVLSERGSRLLPDLESTSGVTGKVGSLSRVSTDPNVLIRLRTYREAWRIFLASPVLGAGHGAMERIAGVEDHTMAWAGNLEAHLLADTGVVGLAAFLAFAGLALARVARASARDGDAGRRHRERLGALLVLVICAQATETSWLASFWVLFGLALAAAREEARADGPTRVLYVHPSDELYGSDRVLLDLVRRLDRERFAPQVLVSSDVPYAGRLTRRLTEIGVPVHRMRIGVLRRRILTSPRALARYLADVVSSTARISRLLSRERIAVVHANTVTVFPAALAARLMGQRLVWHLHEIVTDRPGRALLHGLVRSLADHVVVVSEAARESLGGRSAEVVPNGIEARAPLAPPAHPPVVAYVGRLSARKGPDLLLAAFGRVAGRYPGARLVYCGDDFGGGEAIATELRAHAARLGLAERVELQPFREDVTDLIAAATVIVSPSVLPESFGLILLEAMASGRAVIASDHGGPRELVSDGETGLLVPPADEGALAAALERLLADPALAVRMGEAGRVRARARFDLGTSVSRFQAIYAGGG